MAEVPGVTVVGWVIVITLPGTMLPLLSISSA